MAVLDKHMLDSQQKSNIKYGGNGVSINGTEQFERKLSSPKKPKPKRMSSEESPILEAFMKGGKEHHRDHGVHESRQPCMSVGSKYLLKGAGMYAPSSYRLSREMKARKKKHRSPERRKSLFAHESDREKNERDRGKTNEDSRKQETEGDIFKNSSRSVSSRSSLSRHHPGESPLGARFQLSLASYCREREQKKLRKEQMEQRINLENSFSETSLKSSSIGKKFKPRHEHSKQNDAVPGKSNLSNLVCTIITGLALPLLYHG